MNARSQELLILRSRRGSETSCQEFTIVADNICIPQIFREGKIGVGRGYLQPQWVEARSGTRQVPAVHTHLRTPRLLQPSSLSSSSPS